MELQCDKISINFEFFIKFELWVKNDKCNGPQESIVNMSLIMSNRSQLTHGGLDKIAAIF